MSGTNNGAADGAGEFILYTSPGGTQVQLRAVDGTVWLTQAQLAELYGTSVVNIAQTIKRILVDGEVAEATINSELIVRREGDRDVRRRISVYNLDMILAIGYRVTTDRAVQFRQWATTVLREYLVKGFALQDELLKDPGAVDYFDELLERIRDIRASEKRFYMKICDIFAASSVDYSGASDLAKEFFSTIQNKLLFAVTGRTAAELLVQRSDPKAPNMGLTSWKGERVRKGDVITSKNYLSPEELSELNLLTTRFLDFAEDRARRRQQITMSEWVAQTDRFLDFDERRVLSGPGKVSAGEAERVTTARYAEFDAERRTAEGAASQEAEMQEIRALDVLEQASRPRGIEERPDLG